MTPAAQSDPTKARSKGWLAGMLITGILLVAACKDGTNTAPASASVATNATDESEVNAGGKLASVADASGDAFGRPAPGLGLVSKGLFENGNHLFRTPRGRERGTGPILNAQSCQGCHILDGRGNPPRSTENPLAPDTDLSSMLLRLAQAGNGAPDPVYGDQLQTRSMRGDPADPYGQARLNASLNGGPALGEAKVRVSYEAVDGKYPDGTDYQLLRPVYRLSEFSYGPMANDIRISPRVAPGLYGNGLLDAIDAQAIQAAADPDDANGDGISGRASKVADPVSGQTQLGRFGLKAGTASVLAQSAMAYRGDMGLTNRYAPNEACTNAQTACLEAAALEPSPEHEPPGVDIADIDLAQVEFYARTLAVPKRRGWDPASKQWSPAIKLGREHFFAIGCASCHTPRWQTATAAGSALGDASLLTSLTQPAPAIAALSQQTIWPFTDLLLHDMGGSCEVRRQRPDGQACTDDVAGCVLEQHCTGLADGVQENQASGSEWRTAPLWGVGLVQTVNPAAGFLHDGRARTLEEAVLWHGDAAESEAADSAKKFRELSAHDRAAVLSFLSSM